MTAYFARTRKIDPKPALKKAFARTDRRLQCLQPAKEFTPPARPSTGNRKPPEALPRHPLRRRHHPPGLGRDQRRLAATRTPRRLRDTRLPARPGTDRHLAPPRRQLPAFRIVIRLGRTGNRHRVPGLGPGNRDPAHSVRGSPRSARERQGPHPQGPKQKAHVASFLTQRSRRRRERQPRRPRPSRIRQVSELPASGAGTGSRTSTSAQTS